jgi:hypothetical protein
VDKSLASNKYPIFDSDHSQVLVSAISLYISLTIPLLLIMMSVRLIMTPLFLQLEYNRPGFPADFYGLTTEDRLRYAPIPVAYLLNDADISFLGNLRFPDGAHMYNVRELHHMRDVKTVTQIAYLATVIVAVLTLITMYWLWRRSPVALGTALGEGWYFGNHHSSKYCDHRGAQLGYIFYQLP